MVVRVDRRLGSELAADELDRAVGDDLVEVHVRLRAETGLVHVQREVLIQLAGDDLVADLLDERAHPLREAPIRVFTVAAAFFT